MAKTKMDPREVARILRPAREEDRARQEERVRTGFWAHFRRYAGKLPFAEDLVAAYFCAMDDKTSWKVKGILLAALAYFVLPFDVIPDMLIVMGLTDDIAVLMAAITATKGAMTDEHYAQAREALRDEEPCGEELGDEDLQAG